MAEFVSLIRGIITEGTGTTRGVVIGFVVEVALRICSESECGASVKRVFFL